MSERISNLGARACLAALLGMVLPASPAAAERRVWYVQHPSTHDQWWRANITGTNSHSFQGFNNTFKLSGFAVDWASQMAYRSGTSSVEGSIVAYTFDGPIGPILQSPALRPKYVVQNGFNGELYFFDNAGNDIYRVQNDGTGLTQVYANAGTVTSMAIETSNDYLFWSDVSGAGSIHRISLPNGTGHISAAASNPLVAVDDPSNLVLCRNLFGGIETRTTALTFIEQILPNGTNPTYMATDGLGKVYWSDATTDTIKRADLNGDNTATILSGLAIPTDSPMAVEVGFFSCRRTIPYGDQDSSGNITIIDVGKVVDTVKGLSTVSENGFNVADVFPCSGFGASKACIGDAFVNVQDLGRVVDLLKGVSFSCP